MHTVAMHKRLKKHSRFLAHLESARPKARRALLETADFDALKCLAECCHNICAGNVKLSEPQETFLTRHSASVRKIADRKFPLRQKRKLLQQKGGSIAAAIVAPIVASFLLKALGH